MSFWGGNFCHERLIFILDMLVVLWQRSSEKFTILEALAN